MPGTQHRDTMRVSKGSLLKLMLSSAYWLRGHPLCVGTVLFCTVMACGMLSAPEEHLIPAGYQGDIFIVSEIPDGAPPQRHDGAIVFEIPPTGILVTQDTPSQDWHKSKYFYVDALGNRQRLRELGSSLEDTPANRSDHEPFVWFRRSVKTSGAEFPCPVEFERYYVGTRAHLFDRDDENDLLRFYEFVQETRLCR